MMDIQNLISHSLALFFLCLFGAAGISKFRPANQDYYAQVMKGYDLILPELARVLLYLIAALEIVTGILIVVPSLRIAGVVLAIGLLLLYLTLMAIQLLKGKSDMDCGCNGAGSETNGRQTRISPALLVRNLALVLLAALASLAPLSTDAFHHLWQEWLLAIPLAGCLYLIYLSGDQLIANGQRLHQLKAVMNG